MWLNIVKDLYDAVSRALDLVAAVLFDLVMSEIMRIFYLVKT